jgi:N-acyl-D-amino-acid deacylase
MPTHYDLILRNGTIIDGTGRPGFTADIAISGDAIAEIGPLPAEATASREIDVADHVVAPGFIDIHTHADIALLARPQHLPKIMQGVTTEVFTNCGLGFAPVTEEGLHIQRHYIAGLFGDDGSNGNPQISQISQINSSQGSPTPERLNTRTPEHPTPNTQHPTPHPHADWSWRTVADFLARFEAQGIGANVAYLIPHGALRVSAMGMAERAADTAEVARMLALLAQGMEEGAWGMSTGIWYAPMRAADRAELVALCRAAGFFATHQRDYGERIFPATEESLAIAREADVPVQIAHLQMNGPGNAGRAPELLEALERARESGIDVSCDTYPYTAGSTFVQSLLPGWAVDGGPEAILRRLATQTERAQMAVYLAGLTGWDRYMLVGATSAVNGPLEGLTFAQAAEKRGLPVAEWICSLLEEDDLRACYVHHGAHEGNVRDILRWSGQMIGSDGLHLPGKTHPRLYGTFPRVLGRYVREEKIIPLEQAVHKMTGQPAARLGLKRRGTLQAGYAADMVVFDPATICDTATFEDPLRYPVGIPFVFVNGVAAKWNDAPTGELAGQVLRRH